MKAAPAKDLVGRWRIGLWLSYGLISLGIAVQVFWLSPQPWPGSMNGPVRFLFDTHDIGVYFRSSAWAVGGGTLYRDVPSEYPLAANLIFGSVRFLASLVMAPDRQEWGFTLIWILCGMAVLAGCLRLAIRESMDGVPLVWLLPAVIYFAALRFDIYPAFTLLLAIAAMRRQRLLRSAGWLGVAIALKGFALFLVPCMAVYVFHLAGIRKALIFSVVCLVPHTTMSLATLLFSGFDGLLTSYLFHAKRSFNGESLWDGLSLRFLVRWFPGLPALLTIGFSIGAACLRPRSFDRLIDACLVAVVGFTVSTVFYSPQFCLWILAIASFSERQRILFVLYGLCFVTYFYFPVSFDIAWNGGSRIPLEIAVTTVSLLRLLLIVTALRRTPTAVLTSS